MTGDFKVRRTSIIALLVFLVLADVALGIYSWQLASSPRAPRQEFAAENRRFELLRADVKRAQGIRDAIPAIQKDCDQFENSLLPASSGYSAVSAEVGSIANKSRVQVDDLTFKQKEIPNRNLAEIAMDASVKGEYTAIVNFLNGLQRSKNVYAVDGLALAGDSQNQGPNAPVRVAVHMKTYFRTAR
ncbi:MAG: hypothetical protein NVS9B13_26190 [Candidatus Acidiferrum sp.]